MPTLTNLKISHKVSRKKKHGLLQSLFFMVVIISALFFLLQSSFFNIKTIKVQGNSQLNTDELIKNSGLSAGVNIFKANLQDGKKNIMLNPLIKEANLQRKLPNVVLITVKEREPVGLVPDKNRFIEVDSDGIYLAAVESIAKAKYPIITGDNVLKKNMGEKVDTEKIAAAIKYLVAIPEDVRNTVLEIHVANMNQIILYTLDGFYVRLGGTDNINEKAKLYQALIKQQNKNEKLEYIDIADVEHPAKKAILTKGETSTGTANQPAKSSPNTTPTPNSAGGLGSIPD